QWSSEPRHRPAIALGLPHSVPQSRGLITTLTLLEQLPSNKQNADEIMHMARFDPNVAAPAGAGCKEPERAAVQH
ncbi:hypothetical protein ABIC08_004093, partial [Bradyrhizobium sp. RT9b]|uniref:hypothetical protein n=1 Tax=unclassified Bradyrhizobium TaxID=2631580 RepID=UPI003395C2E4